MERTDELWLVLKVSGDRGTTVASWGPFDDEQRARYKASELAEANAGEDFYILSAQYVASKRVVFDKIEEIPF